MECDITLTRQQADRVLRAFSRGELDRFDIVSLDLIPEGDEVLSSPYCGATTDNNVVSPGDSVEEAQIRFYRQMFRKYKTGDVYAGAVRKIFEVESDDSMSVVLDIEPNVIGILILVGSDRMALSDSDRAIGSLVRGRVYSRVETGGHVMLFLERP